MNIDKGLKWKPEKPATVTKRTFFIYNYCFEKNIARVTFALPLKVYLV